MKYFSLIICILYFNITSYSQCCNVDAVNYRLELVSDHNFGQFTICGDKIDICGVLNQQYIDKFPVPGIQNTLENPIAFEFRAGENDFYANFEIQGLGQILAYELEFPCNDFYSAISMNNSIFYSVQTSGSELVMFKANKNYLVILDGVNGYQISYSVTSDEKTLEFQEWKNNYSIEGPDIVSVGSSANYSISTPNNPTLGDFCGKPGPCCGDSKFCTTKEEDIVYTWTGPNGSIITPTNPSGSEISLIMGPESGELCCHIYDPVNQCIDETICKFIQAAIYFKYEVCPGESISHNGTSYDQPGTYYDYSGPATEIITISYFPVQNTIIDINVCTGETVLIEQNLFTPTQDSTVIFSFINAYGCEEFTTYKIHIKQPQIREQNLILCAGDSILIGGIYYSEDIDITIKDTAANDNGCFDLINYKVFVIPEIASDFPVTIAPGASYNYNGTILTNEGIYSFEFKSIFGCDSTVNVIVNISQPVINVHKYYWCSGETIHFNGNNYDSPGKYEIKTYSNNELLIIDSIIIKEFNPQLKLIKTTVGNEITLNAVIQNN